MQHYFFLLFTTIFFTTALFSEDIYSRGVGIYIDQDMFGPANEDRDYTMGFGIEYFYEDTKSRTPILKTLHKVASDTLNEHYKELFSVSENIRVKAMRSFMFGIMTYSPDDLSKSSVIYDDRPYSSLLYISDKRIEYTDSHAIGTEMQFGVLGTNVAYAFQKWFHERYRSLAGTSEPVEPMGWSNQISDGGEPTLKFRMAYSGLLKEEPSLWDVSWSSDIALGYQTNASLGVAGRIGKLSSRFWSIPHEPISRGTFIPSLAKNEYYVWGAHRSRLVAYDALLQGQFRSSALTYESDDLRLLVHESAVGVTLSYDNWQATVSLNRKSPELKEPASRTHQWGGIYLMYRY